MYGAVFVSINIGLVFSRYSVEHIKGIVAEQNKKERTVQFFKLKMCFSKMYIAFIAPYLMYK